MPIRNFGIMQLDKQDEILILYINELNVTQIIWTPVRRVGLFVMIWNFKEKVSDLFVVKFTFNLQKVYSSRAKKLFWRCS